MADEHTVRSRGLTVSKFHYCAGCTHTTVHHILADCLVSMGLLGDTIGVSSVGCSAFSHDYFSCDMQSASHGRAPAVATGIKRVFPDRIVFTYQGDGDLAAIGLGEVVSAAARGEHITVIYVNNAVYGMTGGLMAPTSLLGQKTTTCSSGRSFEQSGGPIGICEMLSTLSGTGFAARVHAADSSGCSMARDAIRRAFEVQQNRGGFSIVEVLAACPTNWGMKISDAFRFVREDMVRVFPLGVFKDSRGEVGGPDV